MKRFVAPFALCFVLALLVAAPLSIGADKPPKELWDEFPLDATPTPGAQAPERTAAPSAQPQRAETQPEDDSGGISMPALVALLVGAAGLGGGAVFVASRRMRSTGDGPAPEPVVRTGRFTRPTDAGSAAAVAATNGHAREAPAADEPPRKPHSVSREKAARRAKHAKPAPGTPRPRRAAGEPPADKPRPRRRAAPKPKVDEPRARRPARRKPPAEPVAKTPADDLLTPEAPPAEPVAETPADDLVTPEELSAEPLAAVEAGEAPVSEEVPATDEPAASHADAAAADPDGAALAADEAAAAEAAREARRAARRRKRDEAPAAPRRRKRSDAPAMSEAGPTQEPEAGPTQQPEAVPPPSHPRRPAPLPSADEQPAAPAPAPLPSADEQPAAPASARQRREDIGAERIAAPAPQPPVPPPAEPVADVEDGAFPTCRIKLHNRPIRTHFYAVPYEGGPVLARSPYFKLQRGADDSGPTAPEALRALVEELRALGWQQTGVGSAPWDLRFQRGVRVAQRRG
jgi:hypothetical protein